MKKYRNSLPGRVGAVAFVAALALSAIAATRSNKAEITRNLDIFNSLYKELQTNYVDSIDAEKSINTAIAAMLNDIDPYTEYFPASQQEDITMMNMPASARSYLKSRARAYSSPSLTKAARRKKQDCARATISSWSTTTLSPHGTARR